MALGNDRLRCLVGTLALSDGGVHRDPVVVQMWRLAWVLANLRGSSDPSLFSERSAGRGDSDHAVADRMCGMLQQPGMERNEWTGPLTSIAILLGFATTLSGCAFLKLNGCERLATCGDLAVYSCEGELMCADAQGNTIRSEPPPPPRNRCRLCLVPE